METTTVYDRNRSPHNEVIEDLHVVVDQIPNRNKLDRLPAVIPGHRLRSNVPSFDMSDTGDPDESDKEKNTVESENHTSVDIPYQQTQNSNWKRFRT